MALLDRIVLSTLPWIPTPVMRRLASRYIAGEELDDALAKLRRLSERGFPGILDVLGEGITSEAEARKVAETYRHAAGEIARAGLDCYVSVKPTHVGLGLSEGLAHELYASIAGRCRELGLFLRVEMEDHPTTDGTLRVFERLRGRFSNVGVVLQARLFRTLADIERLAPGPLEVRMVKGIYLEPKEIAHTEAEPIRGAYVECVRRLCARGARVSLATHDDGMAERCFRVIREAGYARERYELQVLLGVREELWERWKQAGHVVRVYVPYGPEWRAYSQRRLRKNPQLLRHVIRDALRIT
jgi:proline dehydrogenase